MSYSGRMPGRLREALLNGALGPGRIPHGDRLYYMTGARGGDASHDDGSGAELSAMPAVTLSAEAAERVMDAYCDGLEAGCFASRPSRDIPPNGAVEQQMPPQVIPEARVGQTGVARVPDAVGALATTTAAVR